MTDPDPGPTINVRDPAQPDSMHCIPVELIRRLATGEVAPSDVEDQRALRCVAALALGFIQMIGPKCPACEAPVEHGVDVCADCADVLEDDA